MSKTTVKQKIKTVNDKLHYGTVKSFNWGWFKFTKCILGLFIYCLGINLFVVPNHLYTGGILGLAQILRTFLVNTFNIQTSFDISSLIYYFINIPLFIVAYRHISKTFVLRTIFTVTINSIFLTLIPIPNAPLINELTANILIAGILAGLGIGMVLSTGSSTGGTDILGLVVTKHTNKVTVGEIGLTFNIIVYGICGIMNGIQTMIYSIIYAFFETIILDQNHTQNIKSEAMIFTKEDPKKLIEFITHTLNRGVTYWEAVGGYTHTETYIVYTVLSKYERLRLERHMKEFDPNAFMVGDDGLSVRGNFNKIFI